MVISDRTAEEYSARLHPKDSSPHICIFTHLCNCVVYSVYHTHTHTQAGRPEPPAQQPARVRRTVPTGDVTRSLAELKIIGAGPSRYPRGVASSRDKAANRRARLLPAEYRQKLSHLDQAYHGTRRGEVGPCVARL